MHNSGVSIQDIEFVGGGGRVLAGRLFLPPEPSASTFGLLFVHGLESSQRGYRKRAETVAEALSCACLTFDLSGHGESSGNLRDLTPLDHLADVKSAYDELTKVSRADTGLTGVCGASYGAYIAVLLTSKRPVCKLLLRAPALYDDNLLQTTWAHPRSSHADVDAPELAGTLERYSGGLLILESEFDEIISHGVIDWYIHAHRRAQHRILPCAGHALINESQENAFVVSIIDYFGHSPKLPG